jgi:tetratricopeptide (TPR) repeat protein
MNIPEGLRDVIGRRLSLISKECNQLLSVASVIGRDFRLEVLKKVSGLSEEELFSALEEAKKAAIIEERSGVGVAVSYRFAHAFFRQTLYEETIAPKRIRLHQQVARALEEIYASRLGEHAAELSEHFSHSSDSADLKKAVSYGEMAAKRAMGVYAYGEAVRLLEQALKVQEILDPDDKVKRCDLLLALCDALIELPDINRIVDVEAPIAFSLAESIDNSSGAFRASYAALYALHYQLLVYTPQFADWAERAARYARPDTSERVRADAYLGFIKYGQGDMSEGEKLLTQALDLARRIGDRDGVMLAGGLALIRLRAPQHTSLRRRISEELWASPHEGMRVTTAVSLQTAGEVFLVLGQRQQAEEVGSMIRDLGVRTSNVTLRLSALNMDGIFAVMDGRFEDAFEIADSIRAQGKEANVAASANLYASMVYRANLYQGTSLGDIEHEFSGITEAMPLFSLVLAYLGRKEEAWENLEKHVVLRPGIGTSEDGTIDWIDTLFLETAVIIGHRQAAELLFNRLSGSGLSAIGWYPTCIPRHLGGAAVLFSRYDEARKYYQEAIKVCTEMPFRPELALSKLQLAELLLEHYPKEKKEALEHLDFAIKEFREMKMRPSLERALRHKDILKA